MKIVKGNFTDALSACEKTKSYAGIGTYKEKKLHIFLKHYFEPDTTHHEVPIDRKCADILNENGIIEIQTRSLNNLRSRLDSFLPNQKVTVVYPYSAVKWLCWLDPESGEISKRRKSPRKMTPLDSFYELYKIKHYLSHPNLSIYLIGLETEEIRLLNGWSDDRKKGSERLERYPLSIMHELHLKQLSDYTRLIPSNILSPFTSADYSRLAGVKPRYANMALNCLEYIGIIKNIGRDGRKKLYELV